MALTEAQADKTLRALKKPTYANRAALSVLFGEPAAVTAATKLLALEKPPADAVLLGALQVYADSGGDPAPLLKLIADTRPGIRVLAAQGLLARGDKRGFPVLIAELEGELEWASASRHLARWTANGTFGPPFDADARQRADAAKRWGAWWSASKDRITFKGGRWS